jgi:hypothetical protein
MVFSTTWLEFKDMAQDPLVRREPVSASCNRRPNEGLETQKYSLYPKEHPANCPLWCYPWSAGFWQVFHIVGLCVFSHQSADYSIVVAHLTFIRAFWMTSLLYACRLFAIFALLIFAFVPCLLRMNKYFKTPDLNTQIRSVNILNFE